MHVHSMRCFDSTYAAVMLSLAKYNIFLYDIWDLKLVPYFQPQHQLRIPTCQQQGLNIQVYETHLLEGCELTVNDGPIA